MLTEQTKETFKMKMKQSQERKEMEERQRQKREWKNAERKQKLMSVMEHLEDNGNHSMGQEEDSHSRQRQLQQQILCLIKFVSRSQMLREAECPVCLHMMLGRIWQCSAGHLLCDTCHGRPEVATCPTCRSQFMGRATAVEQIVKTIRNIYK